MGCNCGKKNSRSTKTKGGTPTFRLQLPDGRSLDFGSRLEAEAQRVRLGYVGRIVTF